MVAKTKPWAWLVLSFLILAANCIQHCVHGKPQLRCLYIFGDSYSDNGNNNDLLTSAKSNYLPYGIDFPQGPTGRFTNGKTAIDQIAELLGIQNFPPPFANSTDSFVPEGLNYASGAAGILFETGKHRVRRHEEVFNRLASKIGGPKKAKQHLKKCLYYLNIGTNDYIGNYFLPQFYDTSSTYTLEQYANILIEEYSTYIQG
ncbi:GDSL esterase/lipase, partial [Mucuna pruriens]